jgi:ABC-2 type transport system ATP-binding protein
LQFIARCYKLDPKAAGERIDHWLDQLWLTEKKQAKVSALSRGMRQRLAVARSLLPDPHVILMDEPAAGLDPAGRVQFRRMLANLRDQGKAVIVSSHILADLAEYCTHIAIMGHGKFHKYGTVAEVTGAQRADRANYRIVLAERVADLGTRLRDLTLLTGNETVSQDGEVITFEYDVSKAAAAELLRAFVATGLPVAGFQALTPDLEQAYLRAGIRQVD